MPPFLFIFETSITFIQYIHPPPFAEGSSLDFIGFVIEWPLIRRKACKISSVKTENCQIQRNIIIQPCAMFSLAQ